MGRSIKLKKVAVTGGIASGKSTVCHLFEKLGAYVVSADSVVHQLLIPHTPLGQKIVELLGPDVVVGDLFSQERIAQKVFSSPALLKELEKLIHPEVQKVIEAEYKTVSQTKTPLFVAEVPLLYEGNLESFYDFVIVVISDANICKERFRLGKEEYERRSKRLMSTEEKVKKADLVIENNASKADLEKTIQFIFNDLKETT